jgi:hypothetical protein
VDLEVKKASGELIEKAYDAAKPILDRRRAALRAELDELGSPSGGGSSLRELDPDEWGDATPEERRDRRGPRHDDDRAARDRHGTQQDDSERVVCGP